MSALVLVTCSNINTVDGHPISWCNVRYLDIYLKTHLVFHCCYDHAKRSFYKAFNSIFGKDGRVASEEVTVQLFNSKWLPDLDCFNLLSVELARRTTKFLDSCSRRMPTSFISYFI